MNKTYYRIEKAEKRGKVIRYRNISGNIPEELLDAVIKIWEKPPSGEKIDYRIIKVEEEIIKVVKHE
jgi:hypothetical protein